MVSSGLGSGSATSSPSNRLDLPWLPSTVTSMSSSDPLAAPPGTGCILTYLVNVAFQLDCLIACIFTGARTKTISCWCGEAEAGTLGRVWYWMLSPIWYPVNFAARELLGARNHCEESVGPFPVEEDAP